MAFDPSRKKWAFSEEGGGLQRILREREIVGKPIGNYGNHDIGDIIYAWLVGLPKETAGVIPRALGWLDLAIQSGEENRFGESPDFHRMTLFWAKGLARWMLDGVSDKASFEAALMSLQHYTEIGGVKVLGPDRFNWERQKFEPHEIRGIPLTADHVLKYGTLDDLMLLSCQAEAYEQGIAEFEKYRSAKPPSLKRTLKPSELGYATCLHKARGQFAAEDLNSAGRRMLQSKLEEDWLARGQSIRAATWLKLVYWDRDLLAGRQPRLSPLQTVLMAYQDMPKVAMPEFIKFYAA
jgi:hypothetical protein